MTSVGWGRRLRRGGGRLLALFAVNTLPLLAAEPRLQDVSFHSEALGKTASFTLFRPANETAANGAVLLLVPGRGAEGRSWWDAEQVRAALLAAPFYTVLPHGDDLGESGLLEVMREAERRAPLSRDPRWRAIARDGFVALAEAPRGNFGTVSLISASRERESASATPTPDAIAALQARRVQLVVEETTARNAVSEHLRTALEARKIFHETVRLPGAGDVSISEAAVPHVIAFCTRSFAFENSRQAARHRKRRMIYNDDTGPARASPIPLTAERYLAEQVAPLAGTLVDTVSVDTTAGSFAVFGHRTEVGQMFLTQEGRYRNNLLPQLLKLGTDTLQLWIDQARRQKQEVFWSVRMNDTHDATNPLLLPELKRKHPEWLMGTADKPPAYGKWSAVDYGRAEVRDLVLGCIEEVATRYDIDGIELDFWRHPVFFRSTARGVPAGSGEVAVMTDLLRRIRSGLDRAGLQRGRPLVLVVKSPDSAAYCLALGLDLAGWIREQLVDLWVPGGYFGLEPWSEGVALARRHDVAFHACLPENRMRDPERKQERDSILTLRARALAAWAAGVDGIATFNYEVPEHDPAIWRELGDPAAMRGRPKKYFASYQGFSTGRSFYPAEAFLRLPTLTPDAPETLPAGASRTYDLWIGDDLSGATTLRAQLHLRVGSTRTRAPSVRWNETTLELAVRDATTWTAPVARTHVVPGRHRVTVSAPAELRLDDIVLSIE